MEFIIGWKVEGALHKPKGITKYSKWSLCVLKAIFGMSEACILTWWYLTFRSNLEKKEISYNSSSISSTVGMGNRSLTLAALSDQ